MLRRTLLAATWVAIAATLSVSLGGCSRCGLGFSWDQLWGQTLSCLPELPKDSPDKK